MSDFVVVIIIMLSAGLVGGLAAYLADLTPQGAPKLALALPGPALVRFLVLGVVAAVCVPLFLSLVKSGLMAGIFAARDETRPAPFEDYLVFTGLCLVAAFSARSFIDSVSKQVLRKVEQAEEAAAVATRTASQAEQIAAEAVFEVEALDAGQPAQPSAAFRVSDDEDQNPDLRLSDAEERVLRALSTTTYRTRTGVAQDAGVSRNSISEVLDRLHARKLAMPATSPSTGGARWMISDLGRRAVTPGSDH